MGEMTSDVEMDADRLPRFGPMTYAQADDETKRVYREMNHPNQDNVIFGTFMRNPTLHQLHSPFVAYMKTSTCLPVRHREIAILRNAWRCGADYQWEMHTMIGRECGLTDEEIERVSRGPGAPGWTLEEAAVLQAVDELHDTCRVDDRTWDSLASQYDECQLVEFLVLVGNYRTIAYVMNGVGIRPPSGDSPNLPGNRFLFPAAGPVPGRR